MEIKEVERIWKRNKDEIGFYSDRENGIITEIDKELIADAEEHTRLCIAYAEHLAYDIEQLPEVNQEWQSALSRMKGE